MTITLADRIGYALDVLLGRSDPFLAERQARRIKRQSEELYELTLELASEREAVHQLETRVSRLVMLVDALRPNIRIQSDQGQTTLGALIITGSAASVIAAFYANQRGWLWLPAIALTVTFPMFVRLADLGRPS